MKCDKQSAIAFGLLITVVLAIGGMAFDYIRVIQAEQERDDLQTREQINQIHQELQIIRADIKTILRELP